MRIWAAVFSAAFIACGAATCGAQARPPYEVVRSLHALQDQMVLGNKAARAAMPELSEELAEKLLTYAPTVWREPRNARAAVSYLLSGGSLRVAKRVLASRYCPKQERRLLQGALAYVEGHAARAKALLGDIDPQTLEPILGGHIALVQAALIAKDDPAKAIRLLDVARILAPGTLVEEAALRREIFLLDKGRDFDKFVAMSGEYIRRFLNSAYADNFRQHFSEAVARLDIAGSPQQLAELADLLSGLNPGERLGYYLLLARSSLIHGKVDIVRFAAEAALQLAKPESTQAYRAELYDATASILTNDYDRGLARLEALDSTRLSAEDGLLREAALALAWQIRQWPQADQSPSDENQSTQLPPGLEGPMQASSATIAQAQKSLADTDQLLKQGQP